MIEDLFRSSFARRRMAASQLGIILHQFVLDLHARGHSLLCIQSYGQIVEHFSRWMSAQHLKLHQVNEAVIERFLFKHLPRCCCPRPAPTDMRNCRAALARLLVFLRQTKQITEPVSKPWTNIENLVQEYDHHLDEVAGLAPATRHYRLRYAREFLQSRRGDLSAKILKSYFERRAQHLKPASQRVLAGSLRGLLRFLHVTGRSRQQLTQAIPTPAPWPRSTPPQVLSEGQYASLIKSFDRTTRTGKRDFAMALCLCLLGLRTQEVASLVLQDVDLCKSTIRLSRTKQRRERLLPLPPQLAKGLLDYVKRGRPTTHSQALFVRHRAPLGEALRVHHVRGAMRRAFARCGIDSGRIHLLRHTFATKLHRQGVGLKAIADLLGHACLNTTAGYARVDLDELRQAALPWPERNP